MADTGLVSTFISKCRRFCGDLSTLARDKFDGDGSTLAFRTNSRPVLESSYTVKISGVSQVENTDYTLDKDTGILLFTSAPASGNGNVTIDYKYIVLKDEEWIEVIQNVMRFTREILWEDKIDETTLDAVANQDDYSLSGISSDIIHVVDVWAKQSSDVDWSSLDKMGINVRFYKEQNKLNFRPAFRSGSTYDIRVRYLEAYAAITAVGSTFEPDLKYQSALLYLCVAEFFERLAAQKARDVSGTTREDTYKGIGELLNASKLYFDKGYAMLKEVKPQTPPTKIPVLQQGMKS